MNRNVVLSISLIVLFLVISSCSEQAAMADQLADPFQAVIDRQREDLGIPGVSAAVIFPDGSTWLGVSGYSSEDEPIEPEMLFGLASVSKTYMAALVIQLAQEGFLSVDDRLIDWMPELEDKNENITIHQLLNHTSGLYRYQYDPGYRNSLADDPERIWNPTQILAELQGPPVCRPGNCWGESMLDYVFLGMILEKATGRTVADLLSERFFGPLGLDQTYLYPDQPYPVGLMAHMWWDVDGSGNIEDLVAGAGPRPLAALFSSLWTSGGIHATAEDLALFIDALFTGELIEDPALEQLLQPGPELYPGAYYGYSVVIDRVEGYQAYWHSGGAGYASIFYYFPEADLTIVVLINLMVDPRPIALAIFDEYLKYSE